MTPSRTSQLAAVAVAAGLALTAGCSAATTPPRVLGELRLMSFESCEEATAQLRSATAAALQPWGLPGSVTADMAAAAESADGAMAAPAPSAGLRQALPDTDPGASSGTSHSGTHSGTNVHEAGVDEPDLVKTDGRRIVTVSNGMLRVVDAQRRVQTGVLPLGGGPATGQGIWRGPWQPADLLLHGDRALVMLDGWWGGMPVPERIDPGSTFTEPERWPIAGPRLLLVDLTGQPRVLSEFTVDGSLIDGRAVGPHARIVVRSTPRLSFPDPGRASTDQERLDANRMAIAGADITDWLPRFEVTTGGRTDTGQVECTAMSRPEHFSGTSMLTVLSFDLTAPGLDDGDPVSVVADGETVYSNGTSLYVASDQRWRIQSFGDGSAGEFAPEERTEIYKFDISGPGRPRYAAAGAVPGYLVNQYSLSEWEEHLRVATTTGQAWGEDADAESAVYVLGQRGDELVAVGSVTGLGLTERIYSVRYVGPVGYVVTFRETDPLYTLDLSDPTAPAVRGELKITGYSSYLHPVDGGRLIGVGQEADIDGRVQGTQVSLFDVSDLADPRRLAAHHVLDGHSEAEFDPHAFLWWPAERLLVIPLTSFHESRVPESGALLLRAGEDEFEELAMITHPSPAGMEWAGQIRRSLVIGDTLWTVSEFGLQANALSTFDQIAWIPFE